jgi:hypothetical protein
MQENKNLVQEALIQMKNVEEAIAENAKGILASTMKEEINQLVKESLSEQEDEIEADVEMPADADMDTDNEDEMEMDIDTMDMEDDSDDMEMDMEIDSEESPIDLTDASDEEILKVFKAMSEEDGIIVKKDGEDIHLTDNDADTEYLVKLGESKKSKKSMNEQFEEEEMGVMDTEDSLDDIVRQIFAKSEDSSIEGEDELESEEEDEEVFYEIEIGEDADEDDEDEEEIDEAEDDEAMNMDEAEDDEAMNMDEAEDDEAMNMDEAEDDEAMNMDEAEDDEEEFDEAMNMDEAYNHKKSIKPKGVGIGKGPKFSYDKTAKGGFKEEKKEGPKMMGTGKPKFEYKKGANMEGKSKKIETKEGHQGYKDKEDEKLGMKHGKTAMKDLKGSHSKKEKSRRDDAGFEKRETKEAARTYGMGSKEGRGLRKGISNNRNFVYGKNGVTVESLEVEVSMLREKNEEYRKALNVFREKLNEVAIFNSNLAYATRLFTEHSTTKKEKINILRRFDNVETLKESKGLYKSIKEELSKSETKSINESVEKKINNTVSSGSATTLIESKTYENPQFLRMRDLMSKIG